MLTFYMGKQLGPGDLSLMVRDEYGKPVTPVRISYSIFQVGVNQVQDMRPVKALVTQPKKTPASDRIQGQYFVDMAIPSAWMPGQYELVWYLQQYEQSPETTVYEEFTVMEVNPARSHIEAATMVMATKPGFTPKTVELVVQIRELLSDTNPDRNYHFRPPTQAKTIAGFSQRVGFIWTDETILRLMKLTLAQINTYNPKLDWGWNLDTIPESWAQAVCLGTAAKCLSAEAARWAADEFGYSLNGVSLDIEKSSKYQGLSEQYANEFKEWMVPLTATKPFSAGLRQSRWLLG